MRRPAETFYYGGSAEALQQLCVKHLAKLGEDGDLGNTSFYRQKKSQDRREQEQRMTEAKWRRELSERGQGGGGDPSSSQDEQEEGHRNTNASQSVPLGMQQSQDDQSGNGYGKKGGWKNNGSNYGGGEHMNKGKGKSMMSNSGQSFQ